MDEIQNQQFPSLVVSSDQVPTIPLCYTGPRKSLRQSRNLLSGNGILDPGRAGVLHVCMISSDEIQTV